MYWCLEGLLVIIVLANLLLLASSRLSACIKTVAVQGAVIGLSPVFASGGHIGLFMWLVVILAVVLKGVVFPSLLNRALREANMRRDVEPLVGYPLSVIAGVGALVLSVWLSSRLPHHVEVSSRFFVPVALSTVLVGLFVIVSRSKALTQVLGYLVMENGIYAFGVAMLLEQPALIELGILLDVFVAVFVMGIAIFHISREFDHIDTARLSSLVDVPHEDDGKGGE